MFILNVAFNGEMLFLKKKRFSKVMKHQLDL